MKNNSRMNIAIVSPYPPAGLTHSRQSGIASYTKNLAMAMKNLGHKVSVFGNKLENSQTRYRECGIEVTRCWVSGAASCFQIARSLWSRRKELDVIHVQYTFALYGGIMSTAFFPIFLMLFRLAGIPVVVTMHEVVPLSIIDATFLEETGIKGNKGYLKAGMGRLVQIIAWLSTGLVVHEVFFRDVLVKQYGCRLEKVSVIPHGIEEVHELLSKDYARGKLGIAPGKHVVLFFGYLAKYKGLGMLIDTFAGLDDSYELIIAGGAHPRLKGNPEYEAYLESLHERAAAANGRVKFTGFVDEADIRLYFSTADLLVLPYTRLISASGPLALCVAYNKPFLAAEPLAGVIHEPNLLFNNTPEGLASKIERFFHNSSIREKALEYTRGKLLRNSWFRVANTTMGLYREMVSATGASLGLPEFIGSVTEWESLSVSAGGNGYNFMADEAFEDLPEEVSALCFTGKDS